VKLTVNDTRIVENFRNFLSCGCEARTTRLPGTLPVPPAVIAYLIGCTRWCPPKGEM